MNESNEYEEINLDALQGNFRNMTMPMYTPSPENIDVGQINTLRKMLDKLHFTMLEQETEIEITKAQIVAINCAISALEKVKLKIDEEESSDKSE
jgi:hypothetical protein